VNPKQFQRYLDRDKHCLHCGTDTTLVPNHRANRGMGGSKVRDVPSNIVVLCAAFNGLIEADEQAAEFARLRGWKLYSWEDPSTPVFDAGLRQWFVIDDNYQRAETVSPWWHE